MSGSTPAPSDSLKDRMIKGNHVQFEMSEDSLGLDNSDSPLLLQSQFKSTSSATSIQQNDNDKTLVAGDDVNDVDNEEDNDGVFGNNKSLAERRTSKTIEPLSIGMQQNALARTNNAAKLGLGSSRLASNSATSMRQVAATSSINNLLGIDGNSSNDDDSSSEDDDENNDKGKKANDNVSLASATTSSSFRKHGKHGASPGPVSSGGKSFEDELLRLKEQFSHDSEKLKQAMNGPSSAKSTSTIFTLGGLIASQSVDSGVGVPKSSDQHQPHHHHHHHQNLHPHHLQNSTNNGKTPNSGDPILHNRNSMGKRRNSVISNASAATGSPSAIISKDHQSTTTLQGITPPGASHRPGLISRVLGRKTSHTPSHHSDSNASSSATRRGSGQVKLEMQERRKDSATDSAPQALGNNADHPPNESPQAPPPPPENVSGLRATLQELAPVVAPETKHEFDWEDGAAMGDAPSKSLLRSIFCCELPDFVKKFLWFSLFVVVLLTPGLICREFFPEAVVAGAKVFAWSIFLSVVVLIYFIAGIISDLIKVVIGRIFILRTKVLYYFRGITKTIQYLIWTVGALISWLTMFNSSWATRDDTNLDRQALWFVTPCLIASVVSAIAFGFKSILVKRLAFHFHKDAYFERIQSALFAEYVLEALSEKPKAPEPLDEHGRYHAPTPVREPCVPLSTSVSMPLTTKDDGSGTVDAATKRNKKKKKAKLVRTGSLPNMPPLTSLTSEQPDDMAAKNENRETTTTMLSLKSTSPHTPSFNILNEHNQEVSPDALKNEEKKPVLGLQQFQDSRSSAGAHSKVTIDQSASDAAGVSPTLAAAATPGTSNELTAAAAAAAAPTDDQLVQSPSSPSILLTSDKKFHDSVTDKLTSMSAKSVPLHVMDKLVKFVRKNKIQLSTMSKRMGRSNDEIQSTLEAKQVAKALFMHVKSPDNEVLTLEDFQCILKPDLAKKAFLLFDINKDGFVSKHEVKETVINVYKERKALAQGLSDTKTVVEKLDLVFTIFVSVILVFIWLVLLGIDINSFFLTLSSFILAFAFIFGNSLRDIYESIVFIFVSHPFDAQDRVVINGDHMFVTEIQLLNTVFNRWDGMTIIIPNSVLSHHIILNARRSPNMFDSIELHIHVSTPVEKIKILESRVSDFFKEHSNDWFEKPIIFSVNELINNTTLKLSVGGMSHFSWQDGGARWKRRTDLVLFMKQACEELDIKFYQPEQLIHAKLHGLPSTQQLFGDVYGYNTQLFPPNSNPNSGFSPQNQHQQYNHHQQQQQQHQQQQHQQQHPHHYPHHHQQQQQQQHQQQHYQQQQQHQQYQQLQPYQQLNLYQQPNNLAQQFGPSDYSMMAFRSSPTRHGNPPSYSNSLLPVGEGNENEAVTSPVPSAAGERLSVPFSSYGAPNLNRSGTGGPDIPFSKPGFSGNARPLSNLRPVPPLPPVPPASTFSSSPVLSAAAGGNSITINNKNASDSSLNAPAGLTSSQSSNSSTAPSSTSGFNAAPSSSSSSAQQSRAADTSFATMAAAYSGAQRGGQNANLAAGTLTANIGNMVDRNADYSNNGMNGNNSNGSYSSNHNNNSSSSSSDRH